MRDSRHVEGAMLPKALFRRPFQRRSMPDKSMSRPRTRLAPKANASGGTRHSRGAGFLSVKFWPPDHPARAAVASSLSAQFSAVLRQ
jgi:hypothetical protein